MLKYLLLMPKPGNTLSWMTNQCCAAYKNTKPQNLIVKFRAKSGALLIMFLNSWGPMASLSRPSASFNTCWTSCSKSSAENVFVPQSWRTTFSISGAVIKPSSLSSVDLKKTTMQIDVHCGYYDIRYKFATRIKTI